MPSVSRRYATPRSRFDRPSGQADEGLLAPVVLMVSGGADSTALLVLAATSALDIDDGRGTARIARERLHVLHVNHQLRGIDAEEDEEFVRDLSSRYGIPCTIRRVDVSALAAGTDGNVENAGRTVRYAEAARLANELSRELGTPRSAARIVTAHTADDRAETFFMNAIRGAGASGLSSIPRRRNRIVRPLLDRTHEELCEVLRMRGIVWREDDTNADTRYLRAYVRHELMPVIERRNPRVTASLASTCDILSDEDAYLTSVASRALRDLTRGEKDGLVVLDAGRLAALEVAIARRVVRQALLSVCPDARLEARHVAATLSIVAAGEGSVTVSLGVDVRVQHGLLVMRARRAAPAPSAAWLEVPGRLALSGSRELVARLLPVEPGSDPVGRARAHAREWDGESVLLDAQAAGVDPARGGRLWVDAPHPGEVLCPLGMHGQSKKLSDLLGEARVPLAERAATPVVHVSPTGSVVWVAPLRADERVRCTSATRWLLELTLVQR
ncbi:tRNA lysidine(34) synthetase TilS [Olsenella sp. An188]|uniref:tRNA lysidine(34) synthetase TilS n=1 Tax=Olsenella sp. An188 TaxID=1965579 RepID=UPI000B388A26|nr:tRNA lysidine(34) synthetase TilS [Olsenella sp. An188]OUP37894.1 tRNA lysidine(34) synthetase TilS [Olsenella sp. An188]